jgi:hypothetical protein
MQKNSSSILPPRGWPGRIRSAALHVIALAGARPGYLVCDRDGIFWCDAFKRWCRREGIRLRFGAVGRHGSIAVVERLIKIMKDEATQRILVPLRQARFRKELTLFLAWHNEHRPHTALHGQTPNEVYFPLRPANQRPRLEPRKRWPRASPCAEPGTLIAGRAGGRFTLQVEFYNAGRHLPAASLRRVAQESVTFGAASHPISGPAPLSSAFPAPTGQRPER